MHHHSLYFQSIPFLRFWPEHVILTLIVMIMLLIWGWISAQKLKKVNTLVPQSQLTFLSVSDWIADRLYTLTLLGLSPSDAKKYYPFIGTLFFFIFISNLMGLIPGIHPATANMNLTLGLGVFVFIYYNFAGFKSLKWQYLKHFLGPFVWLSPFFLVIELFSHLLRPLTLSLRLKGNIEGDHLVIEIFTHLVPFLLPIIFYCFGIFVAFIQAFVFCLMTMVYISLSTSHE